METKNTNKQPSSKHEPSDSALRSFLKGHDNQGFKLPDKYFDTLQDKIELRLKNQSKTVFKVGTSHHIWVWSAVAAVGLGLMAFFIFLSQEKPYSPGLQYSQEIKPQLPAGHALPPDSLDSNKISINSKNAGQPNSNLKIEKKDVINLPPQDRQPNITDENISNDEIINYLLDEDFDLSDLTN